MQPPPPAHTDAIRAGVTKVTKDFSDALGLLGFKRTTRMVWDRRRGDVIERIGLLRLSAAGPALTAAVRLRISFAVNDLNGKRLPNALDDGLILGDQLRDSEGRAYHLRFNATTWSTYDKCVADLTRIVKEQGLPWFESQPL